MSKLTGGIFSKPSGQTAGLVFGSARTRAGKVATVREKVPPSNPNTPAQSVQRLKFKESLTIVRLIGASVYRDDFNRAISQLPGFQSMMSIIINSLDDSLTLTPPPTTNTGRLHFPLEINSVNTPNNKVRVEFSTELGKSGSGADKVAMVAISKNTVGANNRRLVAVNKDAGDRSDGFAEVNTGVDNIDFIICTYFQGSDIFEGFLSEARWLEGTS